MAEAQIAVNGINLTHGQAVAVRVALTDLLQSTSDSNALGEDAHGRAMTKAYFDRTSEVLELIHQ